MKRLLRAVLVTYILVVLLLSFFQRSLLYHPRTSQVLPVAAHGELMQAYPAAMDIEVNCADGVTIRGWLLRKVHHGKDSDSPRRPLVIYFHGNAGNRAGRGGWYRLLENAGADILAIDYHGYGDSGGKMSESALEMDCDATWTYATETLGYQPGQITVFGTSLGGAAAVYLTSRQCGANASPAGLCAVATFSSMVDVAGSHYPWLPVGAVLVDRYPSDERIKKVTCPVLVLHGDRDTIVHQKFGRKLFDAIPDRSVNNLEKQWVNLTQTGHNDLLSTGARQVQPAVNSFLRGLHD